MIIESYEKMTTQQKPFLVQRNYESKREYKERHQLLFPFQADPFTPTNHFSFEVKQHVPTFFSFIFLSFKREVKV